MSELKHYGWGIVDKDGKTAKYLRSDEDDLRNLIVVWNSPALIDEHGPYRIVELFYKEEGK